ncbi:hypothetical protein DID88_006028 [Monilinia fructigena]|uniref:ADF-H domain-containing protein n=1 Tax=Monilinia fructigena TaxID=38457 RepID=A0A395J6Q4_9HELO|nr:hypothetical protein DID88_006028 [Monilinia fructigena]
MVTDLADLSYNRTRTTAEHELTNHYSITVDDECIEKFNEMKLQRRSSGLSTRSMMRAQRSLSILQRVGRLGTIPKPRVKVQIRCLRLQLRFGQRRGTENQAYFHLVSPDDPKMMYASTKESFKRALSGLSGDELQANDEADLEENEMLKTVSKGTAALKA